MSGKPMVGVAVFAFQDAKFLAAKRGKGCGVGTWAIPGGRMEMGEHWINTAERELEEETKLVAASTPELLGITNDPCHCGEHWITLWLRCRAEGNAVLTDEVTDYEWISSIYDIPAPWFNPQWQNFLELGITP